ncbi:5,10-methylenetetrahydrofolate reductase [Geodia barretti]|uniref:5,10-methylenetetrahydrofolate reductase n=1 Tax=Geodia barretti TaxID=519541 RepID=A0AA35R8E6_GEOBA|nr:5,10-methylenetetrahydrofolate reductase [Geodia barretti]
MLKRGATISFEFFPPRNADGIPAVLDTVRELTAYCPDFISVTYGAGGSTRQFTEEITVSAKESAGGVEVMAHLTCAGQTVDELDSVLQRLEEAGIENVIALRGDPPRGEQEFTVVEGGFSHASELVTHIKANYEFGIAAACYPEGHTEAVSLEQDLDYAKLKVDNGADFLITQLFFDNNDYFEFADRAAAAGIDAPVVPGILPFLSTPQIRRFTSLCGSKIPADLDAELERLADDDDSVRELGIEYAARQVEGLWAAGSSWRPFLCAESQLLGIEDPRPAGSARSRSGLEAFRRFFPSG